MSVGPEFFLAVQRARTVRRLMECGATKRQAEWLARCGIPWLV
jgi:hypothetical protein